MSKTILQVNYGYTSTAEEHTKFVTPMADPISQVPGLLWKVWLMNEQDKEAGGIYLFESREAASNFVTSAAVTDFAAHPSITNVNAKMFEPNEALSQITRGPLKMNQPV